MKGFLWHIAVGFFFMGLWMTAQPVSAATMGSDAQFTWGQVCVLVAVAAAWGDMRAQLRDVRKDVDNLLERDRERD